MVYKMTTGQRSCCAKPLPCVYGLWALRHQSRLRVDDLCIKFPFYMSLCGSVIVATASRSSSLNSSRSPSVITPSLIIRQIIGRGSDPLMEICTPAQRLSSRMRLHNSQNLSASEPSPRNNSIFLVQPPDISLLPSSNLVSEQKPIPFRTPIGLHAFASPP